MYSLSPDMISSNTASSQREPGRFNPVYERAVEGAACSSSLEFGYSWPVLFQIQVSAKAVPRPSHLQSFRAQHDVFLPYRYSFTAGRTVPQLTKAFACDAETSPMAPITRNHWT